MKRAGWSVMVIAATLLLVLLLTCRRSEQAAEARFAIVERADVHQVIPITGQITYADEKYICATSAGAIARICVREGERVGADAALIRMDASNVSDVLSGMAAGRTVMQQYMKEAADILPVSNVIRAEQPCTVRQVFIEEGAPVAAGTPLIRISSHQQQIVCDVAPVDANRIHAGMWAWIETDAEERAIAAVELVGELESDTLTGIAVHKVVLTPEQEIELPENTAVDVNIHLAGGDDVLSLPVEAVSARDTVWWVHDGRCTEIPAEVVISDEMRAWVHLPEGMIVAIGEFENGQYIREVTE